MANILSKYDAWEFAPTALCGVNPIWTSDDGTEVLELLENPAGDAHFYLLRDRDGDWQYAVSEADALSLMKNSKANDGRQIGV
jgi:hypothetical protein